MNATPNDHDPLDVDPIDRQLRAAGRAMRASAPAVEETARAYEFRHVSPIASSTTRGRSWWPATISIGLAAAAVIGVVVFTADQNEAVRQVDVASTNPDPTAPTPVTEPLLTRETEGSADPVEATVPLTDDVFVGFLGLDDGAGCRPFDIRGARTGDVIVTTTICVNLYEQIGGRSLLIRSEGEWIEVRVDDGSGPFPASRVPDSAATCGVDGPSYAAGDVIEIVGCNSNRYGTQTPIIKEFVQNAGDVERWFVPPTERHDGVELTTPQAVDGAPGVTWADGVIEGTTCTIVMTPGPLAPWFEQCVLTDERRSNAIALVGEQVVQFDTADDGRVVATTLTDRMPLTSGCTLAETVRILTGLGNDVVTNPVVTALRCGAPSNLIVASQLLQSGPPDGLNAVWEPQTGEEPIQFSDTGTGIESSPSAPFPSFATWSPWPSGTDPTVVVSPDVQAPLLDTVAAWAERVDGDPAVTMLAVEPDGLPFVVFLFNSLQQGDTPTGSVTAVLLLSTPDGLVANVAYGSVLCASGVTDDGGSCR